MALSDLTSSILTNYNNLQVEEWFKQGQELPFDDGSNQRVVTSTFPAIELEISYKNISQTVFESLRDTYESNFAKTFILTAGDKIDWRDKYLDDESSVWAFKEFKFRVTAKDLWTGSITLITSVYFDFTQYTDLHTQSSAYSPTASVDTSFTSLLTTTVTPHGIRYEYLNNSIFSSIGRSVRHGKDKSLRKKWQLSWLLNESAFLELLTFYRKRGGIMSKFGMPELGYGNSDVIQASFMKDSLKYEKRVDNFYVVQADIVEVV